MKILRPILDSLLELRKERKTRHEGSTTDRGRPSDQEMFCCAKKLSWALTLKLSRIGARSWRHGKLYLPC
jgi:hypothetical protein